MYLQTSRLQYNLQKVGVFQTALSDKNIQAEACKAIISQKELFFKLQTNNPRCSTVLHRGSFDFLSNANRLKLQLVIHHGVP